MLSYARRYVFHVVVLIAIIVVLVFVNGNGCKEIDKFSPEIGNLKDGDTAHFDRINITSDDVKELEYSDVVMFRTPDNLRNHFIARLVGKPGDRLQIENNVLKRNDVEISEEYVEDRQKYNMPEVLVPTGCLFLLSDRRINDLNDSREYGPIPFTHIVGKVTNAEE